MPSFQASKFLPPGFSADEAASYDDRTAVTIHATGASNACPSCGVISHRVHSRYHRRLADLPMAGRHVVLMLQARRFRCEAVRCVRRIFTRCGAAIRMRHRSHPDCRAIHRTLRRKHPQALGAAHRSARSYRPLPRARPGRPAGGEFCAPLEHAGQQRHPVARRS